MKPKWPYVVAGALAFLAIQSSFTQTLAQGPVCSCSCKELKVKSGQRHWYIIPLHGIYDHQGCQAECIKSGYEFQSCH